MPPRKPGRRGSARGVSASTTDKGRRAEELAVAHLEAHGYEIVVRNFRCRSGELDVVARDGECLVFVEIRSREDGERGSALATVGPAKQRQVAKIAEVYLARHPWQGPVRFDVIGITGGVVDVVVDAFRPGLP